MAPESLRQIIIEENELHSREEAEQFRASQWLAEQEAAIKFDVKQQLASLSVQLDEARNTIRERAESEASVIVGRATQSAGHLHTVSDDVLRKILRRHLAAMLVGKPP